MFFPVNPRARRAAQLWTQTLGKNLGDFQAGPPPGPQAAKKTNPDSSRSLSLLPWGTSLPPGCYKDHPRNRGPPPLLPPAGHWKRPPTVPVGRQRAEPHGGPSPAGAPRGPAGRRRDGGSLREAPRPGSGRGRVQPPTGGGGSSIITPLSPRDLSRNEPRFLPGAFYPGWRRDADRWGRCVWCHSGSQRGLPPILQPV